MSNSIIENLKSEFATEEWPDFITARLENDCYTLNINIHKDIKWFEGHFPSQPVLAGVVQTHWAAELSKYLFAIEQNFLQLTNLKFQNVVIPDIVVSLALEHNGALNSVKFRFFDAQQMYSEGKLIFAKD